MDDGTNGSLKMLFRVAHRSPFPSNETGEGPSVHRAWRILWPPALLLIAAVAALPIDVPLARWLLARQYPAFFREIFEVMETFGHGLGILLVAISIYVLDSKHRWHLHRMLGAAGGAGLVANGVKLMILRTRPHHFDLAAGNVRDSFAGLLPLLGAGHGGQSFPSAHMAAATAWAFALSCTYPHGRGLFATFAVMVGMQRMQSGAHFLSDVLCGAAVGWLVALACCRATPLARWFSRLEQTPTGAAAPIILPLRDPQSMCKKL
jgi:membrane-associated phospholipid phosphatase